MCLLEETSSVNNDGVCLFEDGRFLEAVDYFQLCLDQVTEYQIDQQFRDEHSGDTAVSAGEAANVSAAITNTATRITPTTIESSSNNPFHGWSKPFKEQPEMEAVGSPFILARVLRIRYHQEQEESMNDSFLHSHKAALYYNLAVTHQVLLRQPSRVVAGTSTAAMMIFRHYEAAYLEYKEATSSDDDDDESTQVHHHAMLCLALFNNMGVVFLSEIAQFQRASECFKAACGVMCGLMNDNNNNGDGDDNNCSEVLECGEIYEISLNAFLVPSEACPAA